MTFSIKEIRLVDGSRMKLLLKNCVPDYWPSLYVLTNMRNRSPNTQQRFLSDIIFFFTWLDIEKINIEHRLKNRPNSQYLTDVELSKFVRKVNFTKFTLDKLLYKSSLHPTAYRQVSASHAESRMITVKNYLCFIYENLGQVDENNYQISNLIKRINLNIKISKPTWKRKLIQPKRLNSEQEYVLLTSLHPDSDNNPWPKSEIYRVRNFLVILLLFDLGIRRGELLGIKLSDIDFRKNRVQIIHRPNDPDDPRLIEPLIKTNERSLPVSEALMAIINLYINYRGCYKHSKKHPYLILAHGKSEGRPLSIKSVDAIFNIAKKNFPVLEGVTAHSLRHNDVYHTIKAIASKTKELPIEDRMQMERRVLTYKYGWSDMSNMPNLYGQNYYQEEAEKAMDERNKKLTDFDSMSKE